MAEPQTRRRVDPLHFSIVAAFIAAIVATIAFGLAAEPLAALGLLWIVPVLAGVLAPAFLALALVLRGLEAGRLDARETSRISGASAVAFALAGLTAIGYAFATPAPGTDTIPVIAAFYPVTFVLAWAVGGVAAGMFTAATLDGSAGRARRGWLGVLAGVVVPPFVALLGLVPFLSVLAVAGVGAAILVGRRRGQPSAASSFSASSSTEK